MEETLVRLKNFLDEAHRTNEEIAAFRTEHPETPQWRSVADYFVSNALERYEQEQVRYEQDQVRNGEFFSRIDQVFQRDPGTNIDILGYINQNQNQYRDDNDEFYKSCCRPAPAPAPRSQKKQKNKRVHQRQ